MASEEPLPYYCQWSLGPCKHYFLEKHYWYCICGRPQRPVIVSLLILTVHTLESPLLGSRPGWGSESKEAAFLTRGQCTHDNPHPLNKTYCETSKRNRQTDFTEETTHDSPKGLSYLAQEKTSIDPGISGWYRYYIKIKATTGNTVSGFWRSS